MPVDVTVGATARSVAFFTVTASRGDVPAVDVGVVRLSVEVASGAGAVLAGASDFLDWVSPTSIPQVVFIVATIRAMADASSLSWLLGLAKLASTVETAARSEPLDAARIAVKALTLS